MQPLLSVHRRAVILPLCYMIALFLLSSVPGDGSSSQVSGQVLPGISPQWQNLLHIPCTGANPQLGLGIDCYPLKLASAFVLTLAWAVVDERYQMSVPGRYGSMSDPGLNILGAFMRSSTAIHLVYKRPT